MVGHDTPEVVLEADQVVALIRCLETIRVS